MKVLITGSRTYRDWPRLQSVLNELHAKTPITLIIHGGATGADTMGANWAVSKEINNLCVPAKWSQHGKAAGPLRNTEMLEWKPEYYMAFPTPDSRGTYDMIRKLDDKNIPGQVIE